MPFGRLAELLACDGRASGWQDPFPPIYNGRLPGSEPAPSAWRERSTVKLGGYTQKADLMAQSVECYSIAPYISFF
ncbi:MAG: hypothetical protein ACJ74Z_09920 [Bryobacteraceae bacterium]